MKRRFLILVTLLLVSMVSMATITQSGDSSTRIFVNPSSVIDPTLQPQTARTIWPNADGTFGNWTNSTVVLSPNGDGTYGDWNGRMLTLSPNGEGTYSQWPAWIHLQPRKDVDQNYTKWAGTSGDWNDWPDPIGDATGVVSASSALYNNANETSALTPPPTERRSLTIQKVRVNIVARYYVTSGTCDEQVQMMLCTVLNASVSGREVDAGWDGWARTGSSPWLDKEDYPSNYINSSVTGDRIGNFTFADIPEGLTWNRWEPGGAVVRFRIWQSPLGDDSIKIHLYNGTHWKTFTGLTPKALSDPSYVEYGTQTDFDVYDFLNTRDKINNAKMAIEKVTVGTPDAIYIDYAFIRLTGVTTPSSFGVTTGLTPSYRTYYSDWSTNPLTGLAWTWSDIDALQAGVRAIQVDTWSGTLRVTQLYVGILTNQGLYTEWDEYPDPTGPNGGDEDFFSATADALLQSSALTNHTVEANVNGRVEVEGWDGWTKTGASPWLDASDYPSHYIYNNTADARMGNFTFADVPLGTTPSVVTLRLKTWKSGDAGGSDQLKIYLSDGTSWNTYTVTPPTASAPGSYVETDVTSFLNTREKINATMMAIEHLATGTADTIGVDHAYIRVSQTWPISKVRVTAVASNPDTLYVSGREVVTGWDGWTKPGSSPWLDAADYGANYIYTSAYTAPSYRIGNFTFRDAPPGSTWDTVALRLRAWRSTSTPQLKIYLYNGVSYTSITIADLSTTSGSYYPDIDVSSFLNSEAKINAAKMAFEKLGTSGYVYVDYACLSLGDREKIQLMVGIPPFESQANVDGFDNTLMGWTRTGSSPYLDAADYDTNYISTTGTGVQIGDFSFQNVPSGTTWGTVKLRIKTWQSSGGDDQLGIYLFDGTSWSSAYTVTPSTTLGYYPDIDVSSFLNSEAKINAAKMRLTKLRVGGGGSDDTVYVDHAYLYLSRVYYGVETALTTTYTEYTSEWSTSPATGLPWTWAEIDALEVGVKSKVSGLWTGEIRVTQLYVRVIEAGSYTLWDEPPPDCNSDIDYVSAIAGGLNQTSGLENQPAGATWTPARVQVTIVAKRTRGNDQIRIRMRLGTTNVDSADLLPSTGATAYASYSYFRTTDPTGGAWSWDDINALEVGVLSIIVGTTFTEVRVTQLYVIVGRDGTYANWADMDENTYFSATMTGMKESSQLEDIISPPTWDIGRVRVVIVAKTNLTTDEPEQVQLMLVMGGATYFETTTHTPTTSYQTYTADWGKNPRYNIPWNWTAINTLEAGVISVQFGNVWKGEIRIAELYVEIAGPRFTVNIDVENVVDLFGYSIQLKYDTTVTTATAIIFNYTSLLTSQAIQKEEVNDALGYAWLGSQSTAGLKSGSGTLATIVFLVDSTGTTLLDLRVKEFYTAGFVDICWIVGDVDVDRTIDASDLSMLSNAYGSKDGDPNYKVKADCNSDGKVDVFDLFAQSKNYGKTYAYDGYFSNS